MSFVAHFFGRSDKARSVIAPGTIVRGDISGATELVVAGVIDGDITATAVTVAEGGRIDGDVAADVLYVAGTLSGTCVAKALAIGPTGTLRGEATYEKLEVEPGAVLEARCHTRAASAVVVPKPAAKPAAVAARTVLPTAATA